MLQPAMEYLLSEETAADIIFSFGRMDLEGGMTKYWNLYYGKYTTPNELELQSNCIGALHIFL
jgi:hypothetical protein